MEGTDTRASALADTRVEQVMGTLIVTCAPDTPLREAAEMMARHRIHSVVVFHGPGAEAEPGRPWGIVSDLDVVAAGLAGSEERPAGEAAASPVVTIRSDDTLERAAQLMVEYASPHLIAVDPEHGRPAGILSSLDIARVVARRP